MISRWGYISETGFWTLKLTDTAIKKARAREKAYNMSDGEGLFLRIAPSGGKLWRWKYRSLREIKVIPMRDRVA